MEGSRDIILISMSYTGAQSRTGCWINEIDAVQPTNQMIGGQLSSSLILRMITAMIFCNSR